VGHEVGAVKQWLKQLVFRLLRKDPDAVVVTFCSGDPELCRPMVEEVQSLTPDRRHFVATSDNWAELRLELRHYRIGLAPVMLGREGKSLRRAAYRAAPHKILAYNSRLERHHLGLNLSSFLFWRGVPLDRIHLRPWWWPTPQRERSTVPQGHRVVEGRPCVAGKRRIAVLSPYFPFPLSHGGAVRIFHLLRELSREFDVELFAFADGDDEPETSPVLEFCARVVLVGKPRYREPRWSSFQPPEVLEFQSPAMRRALAEERRLFGFELLQVEYTQLAGYAGDVLVEHDVTFDLFGQVAHRNRTLTAWWDYWRWRRFEMHAVSRYRRIVTMSQKDAELLGSETSVSVIENGVDLDWYRGEREMPGQRLLFVGSFRHFPNVTAFRFLTEQVWPILRDLFPQMSVTVVCGMDHLTYWRAVTDSPEPPPDERIRMLGFISDLRPLYAKANLVLVPTTVSAGTNIKVLEAMAMCRAVVSTSCGCAGLGLLDGHSVWIADTPQAFAAAVATLIKDPTRRDTMAQAAYGHVVRKFDWRAIGEKQRALLRELL
jgi:glycosyltransferase involved in cell wall biosynthesis